MFSLQLDHDVYVQLPGPGVNALEHVVVYASLGRREPHHPLQEHRPYSSYDPHTGGHWYHCTPQMDKGCQLWNDSTFSLLFLFCC